MTGQIIRIDSDRLRERLYREDGTEYDGYVLPLSAVLGDTKPRGSKMVDRFVFVFIDGLVRLALDKSITNMQLRVLAALLARSEPNGAEWEIKPKDLGEALGLPTSRISTSVTALEEAGYLRRTRKGFVTFDPTFAWRGNAASRDALKDVEKENQ